MRPSNSLIASTQGSASFASSTVFAWDIVRCSFQVVSGIGTNYTFALQGSNDKPVGIDKTQFVPTYWNTIASASVVVCSVGASITSFMIPPTEVCYQYLRVYATNNHAPSGGSVKIILNSFGL